MQNLFTMLVVVVALQALTTTSDHDQTQSGQTQLPPVPCVTTSTPPNPSGNNTHIKVPNRLQEALKKQLGKIQSETGVDVGGMAANMQQAANARPAPCLPQAASPKTTQPVPALRIPAGVVTTWMCNPIITSTDPSHTVTFITPDALTVAEPAQAGAFEADGAKADPKATVSCANLRRDPKNNKVFLAQ